jgi:hypothetical protein
VAATARQTILSVEELRKHVCKNLSEPCLSLRKYQASDVSRGIRCPAVESFSSHLFGDLRVFLDSCQDVVGLFAGWGLRKMGGD